MFQKTVHLWLLYILTSCQGDFSKTRHNIKRAANHSKQLRIYNGDNASGTEFPFMALVLANTLFDKVEGVLSQNMCGGSILSESIILTAAHCVVRDVSEVEAATDTVDQIYHPRNLYVWVGDLRYESSEQFRNVKGIIVHEEYDSYSVVNDIALLIVEPPISLTDDVATIALPEEDDLPELYAEGAAVTVIGWGTTESGDTSDILQKLSYQVTDPDDCMESYHDQIQDGMMCTGTSPMLEHSSTGDSGGPLFTKVNGEWTQIGLVSWGADVQTANTYDVNTNVGYYRHWIKNKMKNALTAYVSSITATDRSQTMEFPKLRKFLYKTILIKPGNTDKFTKITIKSGTMYDGDFVMVYDGDSVITDRMLGQLSGDLQKQCFTATSTKGLTLAILTGMHGRSDGFKMEYKQVSKPGYSTDLICATGFSPCSDKFYCLQKYFFCDDIGQCADASDEETEICERISNESSSLHPDSSCSAVAVDSTLLNLLITTLYFIRTFL